MKLGATPYRATQDRRVIVESSDRTWSTGGGNGKPLQYSCHKNPMHSIKRQKDMTRKRSPAGQMASSVLLGKSGGQILIAPERMKWLGQSGNDAQLWVCLVMKLKSNAIKNNTA